MEEQQMSWREKLKGEACNTWLHHFERVVILSQVETLSEPAAKVLYFATRGRIEDRIRAWEQSL